MVSGDTAPESLHLLPTKVYFSLITVHHVGGPAALLLAASTVWPSGDREPLSWPREESRGKYPLALQFPLEVTPSLLLTFH